MAQLLYIDFLYPSHFTFQVAAQQGAYLADCFNRMEDCEKNPEGPIRFRGTGRHRFRPFRYVSYLTCQSKKFIILSPLGLTNKTNIPTTVMNQENGRRGHRD